MQGALNKIYSSFDTETILISRIPNKHPIINPIDNTIIKSINSLIMLNSPICSTIDLLNASGISHLNLNTL